jgi:hypothetical protein
MSYAVRSRTSSPSKPSRSCKTSSIAYVCSSHKPIQGRTVGTDWPARLFRLGTQMRVTLSTPSTLPPLSACMRS